MFNDKLFKQVIVKKGLTLDDVAKSLNINPSTLYRKMVGQSDFYRNEIQLLCKLLEIENPQEIFLQNKLRKRKKNKLGG